VTSSKNLFIGYDPAAIAALSTSKSLIRTLWKGTRSRRSLDGQTNP
jgi:hypothetical protein